MKRSWGIIALFRTSAAATLVGLEVPPPAMNLEIKPSAISRLTTDLLASPVQRNEFDPDVGLDVKYGVTKSLTADFTYNTDFAQVEADEVQVNLTRFNLLFPEKRDFFLEGQGLFTFGGVGGAGPPNPKQRLELAEQALAIRVDLFRRASSEYGHVPQQRRRATTAPWATRSALWSWPSRPSPSSGVLWRTPSRYGHISPRHRTATFDRSAKCPRLTPSR